MANSRNVTLTESSIRMGDHTTKYWYRVIALKNIVEPHIGAELDVNEVKWLMRKRNLDVTIRRAVGTSYDGELDSSV